MPQAIIMAGGQGERFWPMTHEEFPKYRVHFEPSISLLQKTYQRLQKVYPKKNIHVVTTAQHVPYIRQELKNLDPKNIIIEPFRNNTAAAIFLSTSLMKKKFGPDEVISFFPADHLIQNIDLFKQTLNGAIDLAKSNNFLVTVGITPTFPATGLGYVEMGSPIKTAKGGFLVKRFVEKPNFSKAKDYLREKTFLWNGGIFTWRTQVFLDSMKKFAPVYEKNFNLKNLKNSYKKLPKLSIDYALLEKTDNMAVFQTQMDWCDMGCWDMLHEKSLKDSARNVVQGVGHHKGHEDSLIINHSKRPVITLGISNLIVIQTDRGTLICPKGRSEEAALLFRKLESK